MSQYRTGTVTVSGESNTVIGSGTSWSSNVSVGSLFKKQGVNTSYEIAAVPSDTELTLATNYVGSGESGMSYNITTDFTPNLELPEVWAGDIDWPWTMTKSLRAIDTAMGQNLHTTAAVRHKSIALSGEASVSSITREVNLHTTISSDNKSALGIYSEQVVEDIGTFTASHKYKIKINGVEYWIQLDAV